MTLFSHARDAHTDETDLLLRARDGDPEAFREWIERFHLARLSRVCARICPQPADADDAIQETLLRAWRGLARFEGRSKPSVWLYRIAVNASLRVIERQRDLPVDDPFDNHPSPARDPADRVADVHTARWALNQLPPQFRTAVVLADGEQLPYREIAATMGWPLNTVRTRVRRGRLALLDVLTRAEQASVR